jgi:hypothetical protein
MSARRGRPPGTKKEIEKTTRQTFDLMRALVKKIGCQFPDTPEGRLMLSVINIALSDLITNRGGIEAERFREDARRYLSGDMWHALLCGVDPEWIRLQLRIAGFEYKETRHGLASVEQIPDRDGRGLHHYAVAS